MLRHALHATVAFVAFAVGASVAGVSDFVRNLFPTEAPAPVVRQETAPECNVSALSAEQEAARREIFEIYRQYDIAQTNHDAAFFENIETENWVMTRDDGEVLTRSQAIAEMKTWLKGITYRTEDIWVQFYGETAIVTSRKTEAYPGEARQDSTPWLDIWQKRDGRWRIISTTLVD